MTLTENIRYHVYVDSWNSKAIDAAKAIKSYDIDKAHMVLVFGGDGTMIRAIKECHKYEKPFYGINYGHLGFLLNPKPPGTEIQTYTLPMLEVSWDEEEPQLAVNDAWVERATAQTAKLKLYTKDKARINTLFADGLLVATPQGSTAYARSMGGIPLPLDTNVLQVVGSNVSFPQWKSALLDRDETVDILNLDSQKRPINLYIDGEDKGRVEHVAIKRSRRATFTLCFDPSKSLAEKITDMQFPQ